MDYSNWMLAILVNNEMPMIWQLRRIQGASALDGNVCEDCGVEPTLRPGDRAFYRTESVSDPDGHDPQLVYCWVCIERVHGYVNNFYPIGTAPKTYMWKVEAR